MLGIRTFSIAGMLVRWVALIFGSSLLLTPAQRAPVRGGSLRESKPTLEELRADPPGDWAEQRRQIEEVLAVRGLEESLRRSLGGPLALDSARKDYPKLEAARAKMAAAEDEWERRAWKDDEFLELRLSLALIDARLLENRRTLSHPRVGGRTGAMLEEREALAARLGKIEERLAGDGDAGNLLERREEERAVYRGMIVKLAEFRKRQAGEDARGRQENLRQQMDDRVLASRLQMGIPRELPEDQLPQAERNALAKIASLERRLGLVDEEEGDRDPTPIRRRPDETHTNARKRAEVEDMRMRQEDQEDRTRLTAQLRRVEEELAQLQAERARRELEDLRRKRPAP